MARQGEYWFDAYGNLAPYTLIPIDDLLDFETTFVSDFVQSTTRQSIFAGLLEYLGDMGVLLMNLSYKGTWNVWLDGSFTTEKINPNDVDLLNVFDNDALFEQHKHLFKSMFASNAETRYGVDAYFLLNDNSAKSTELTNYWKNQFGMDRNGRSKGVIHLAILFS